MSTTPSMGPLVMSCVVVTPTEVWLPVSGLTFTRFPAVCAAFTCLVRESTHTLTFAHRATAFGRSSLLIASSNMYEGIFPVMCSFLTIRLIYFQLDFRTAAVRLCDRSYTYIFPPLSHTHYHTFTSFNIDESITYPCLHHLGFAFML